MNSKRIVAGLLAMIGLVALGLTGCGPKQATLTVELKDFAYVPNQWSVPAGAQVTLNVRNSGTQIHEWVLMKKDATVDLPWGASDEPKLIWELDDIQPGESKTATFTAPTEPGDYQVVCGQPAHIEQGMKGTLTVTP